MIVLRYFPEPWPMRDREVKMAIGVGQSADIAIEKIEMFLRECGYAFEGKLAIVPLEPEDMVYDDQDEVMSYEEFQERYGDQDGGSYNR